MNCRNCGTEIAEGHYCEPCQEVMVAINAYEEKVLNQEGR